MLRRDPTIISLDQTALKELKDAIEAKHQQRKAEQSDSMSLDGGETSTSSKLVPIPFNALENAKVQKSTMTTAQRLGLAD